MNQDKFVYLFQGYTNADNPFGDEHLLDHFVWGKKMEKEGKKNLTEDEIQKHQKQKMEESRVCLVNCRTGVGPSFTFSSLTLFLQNPESSSGALVYNNDIWQ